MNWKHFFFCDWTEWKTKAEYDIFKKTKLSPDGVQVGYSITQERVCNVCKKIELRTERIYI